MPKVEGKLSQGIYKKPTWRKWLILIGAVVVLIAFDLSPFGGNIKFYSTWIKCGHKPVVLMAAPGSGISWYEEPSSVEPVRFLYQKYYCTPLEAEQAGLSASPTTYEVKYLNK